MGSTIIWLIIMAPVSMILTGIGIYAWKREKPMWFWSGSTVKDDEITDIKAYNKANGIMWIAFSAIFWISTIFGVLNMKGAGLILIIGSVAGGLALPIVYNRIYSRYYKRKTA